MLKGTPALIRPPALRKGDRVRVISPSLPSLAFATQAVSAAEKVLMSMGFVIDYGVHAFEISEDGRSAGPPEMRAADFMDAIRDPRVSCIMSAIGGSSSRDLLPFLDPDVIRQNPKAFVGRSDNTFLNAFLLRECGMASFNGVAFLSQFGDPRLLSETFNSTREVLLGDGEVRYQSSEAHTVGARQRQHFERHEKGASALTHMRLDTWLQAGKARGRLVGGEVGLVAELAELNLLEFDDAILWLDVGDDAPNWFGEHVERIVQSSRGSRPRGIMVSHNPWVTAPAWIEEVAQSLGALKLRPGSPVLVGGDIGHYQPAWLLPYGDDVILDSSNGVVWPRW